MGIYNTRNPVLNSQQWMAGGYTTTAITVSNNAAGVDLIAAVAGSNNPRFAYITVDPLVANSAPVFILLGAGTVSPTNHTFSLEPGITLEIQIAGEKISAISSTANSQTVRVGLAPGIKS